MWPPPGVAISDIKRVVFVAGGVGINPLMSILSSLAQEADLPREIRFIYTVRDSGEPRSPNEVLFLRRLITIFQTCQVTGELGFHLTPGPGKTEDADEQKDGQFRSLKRRVTKEDVLDALGPVDERQHTLCYICGVPTMTDEYVEMVQKAEGIKPEHVLFERWW